MSPEQLFALATARGVRLDADALGGRSTDGGVWEPCDVARACAGLSGLPWRAALYTLAGSDSERPAIMMWLDNALKCARKLNGWAGKVLRLTGERSEFDEELVCMFMIEERSPEPFRVANDLRAAIMNVESDVWRRTLNHQYLAINAEYQEALQTAEAHVRRRLRDE